VDSDFPNGIPNPYLEENRPATTQFINDTKSDFGIAFDGDFDRCFFFDEKGSFVNGEYIIGILAEMFLKNQPLSKIVHDTRSVWNVSDVILQNSGIAVQSKTGHAFIKQKMRSSDAVYGGEISAHHYFKDFAFCDSGMIPWMLMLQLLSVTNQSLLEKVRSRRNLFPSSGELNFSVEKPKKALNLIEEFYSQNCEHCEKIDGISMIFKEWRFNLRLSNTEQLVRLNVEGIKNEQLVSEKVSEIKHILCSM